MNNRITEGYMPFMGYQTYYRIVGEPSEKAPLLLLHGGPGSTHNYFEVLDCIAETGRQVVSYDQIGCGNSYLDGHPELWTRHPRASSSGRRSHPRTVVGGDAGNSLCNRREACWYQVADSLIWPRFQFAVGQ